MKRQLDSKMPDAFDRQLAALDGVPGAARTKPSTVRSTPPLGIGGTQTFIVQTVRHPDGGGFVFLEVMDAGGPVRLVVPPAVSDLIARQRDALTAKVRSRAAKATAAERKARGERPAFLRRAGEGAA